EIRDRTIYGDDVLFFVIIFGAQQFIDNIAVVGQQNQAFRILVQSAYGENPSAVADEVDDVVLDMRFRRVGNSHRLIECNVDLLLLGADEITVHAHFIAAGDLCAEYRANAVAGDAPRFDPFVGFAPRAAAGFADVFIQPHEAPWVSSSKEGADMICRRGWTRAQQLIGTFEEEGLLRDRRLAIHRGNRRQYQSANQIGSSSREPEGNCGSKANPQHVDPAQAQVGCEVRYGARG